MTTHESRDGRSDKGKKRSEMLSASTCCGGLDAALNDSKLDAMANEKNPYLLIRAIATVYFRWIADGKEPGSDNLTLSPAKCKALIADIKNEWELYADVHPDDDRFPYRKSTVLRDFVDFRKLPDSRKVAVKTAFRIETP